MVRFLFLSSDPRLQYLLGAHVWVKQIYLKLLILDRNTWKHKILLTKNYYFFTGNHVTVYKQMTIIK